MINSYYPSLDPHLKVMFICRGSTTDGMGHVTRTRSVAQTMREFAAVKIVVLGEDVVCNLLAERHLDFTVVADETDAIALVDNFQPDIVVFDLLRFATEAFQAMRSQGMLIVSICPIFDQQQYVDVIFHRTSVLNDGWPSGDDAPLTRSGLAYTVVSEHARRIPEGSYRHSLQQPKLAIALSMGGADAANKTLSILESIKQLSQPLLIWTLLGEGYSHSYQNLVDCMVGSRHEIILAKTNDSMWRILTTCSLVVLAGGTTTYEAVYAGLPSINLLETQAHSFLIQELVEANACISIPDGLSPEGLLRLNQMIMHLQNNREELLNMHHRSRGLVDGRGADRMVTEMLELYYAQIPFSLKYQ